MGKGRLGRAFVIGTMSLTIVGATSGVASASNASKIPVIKGTGPVDVLYAGSLVAGFAKYITPGFQRTSGFTFAGYPGGSGALASAIQTKVEAADVFVSAAPSADLTLEGASGGNNVSWYSSLGTSPVVIGYNPHSKFAAAFKSKPWATVLRQSGILIGRTDPAIDPKGALTESLLTAEGKKIRDPGLNATVLGSAENPKQIFPESSLVANLQSGQLDAGFFFQSEAVAAGIPYVSTGLKGFDGAYTVTLVNGALHPRAGESFIQYLYSKSGQGYLKRMGIALSKPKLAGKITSVPKVLRGIFS